jgi:DNA mismatch repair ATPase MutS
MKALSQCFYLWIPLDTDEASIREMIGDAMQMESAVSRMTRGEISPDELLQIAEVNPMIPKIDKYIDELDENLIELESKLQLTL